MLWESPHYLPMCSACPSRQIMLTKAQPKGRQPLQLFLDLGIVIFCHFRGPSFRLHAEQMQVAMKPNLEGDDASSEDQ